MTCLKCGSTTNDLKCAACGFSPCKAQLLLSLSPMNHTTEILAAISETMVLLLARVEAMHDELTAIKATISEAVSIAVPASNTAITKKPRGKYSFADVQSIPLFSKTVVCPQGGESQPIGLKHCPIHGCLLPQT